ncbi:hypothetical protein EYF80_042111 [Liparis tanakae]|uniref:Interleukin-17C n=1 Tax=Liparis tanakae TaxID=230148 RepID=A0A4Z2G278_9TELE|nr:hypothetical protein EYF80_042111 [Liparis tanakae]
MKQMLVFGLCLVPVWSCKMHRCYKDSELVEAAQRKLRSHYPQPPEPAAAAMAAAAQPGSPVSCPVALFPQRAPEHVHDRLVPMKDHFPPSYAAAQCLCSGCVLVQAGGPPVESHDYNSNVITQSRVFLKKELCDDGERYHLKPVAVKVAVGCTCTRPKSYN